MKVRSAVAVLALVVIGCTTATPSTSPVATDIVAPPTAQPVTLAPSATETAAPPTPVGTGFAFEAPDVIAYYQSIGYACDPPVPSTLAAGYTVTACRVVDDAARTRVVGIVTDAAGTLGNGYAGMSGAEGETYLDPEAALDPLAGFLGAVLGAERGGEAAVWLREHLGDAYAEATFGSISVATYTGADDDPSQLYVEVADPAYLEASPAPG
jgi:hypothetical protein